MRIFTSPYPIVVPIDCSTHMKFCFIRKTQFVAVDQVFNAGKMTLTKRNINQENYHTK